MVAREKFGPQITAVVSDGVDGAARSQDRLTDSFVM
jgi:hypothetical protein